MLATAVDLLLIKVVASRSIIRYFSLGQKLHMPIVYKSKVDSVADHSLPDVGRKLSG